MRGEEDKRKRREEREERKKAKVEGVCEERGEEIIIGDKHEEKKNGNEEIKEEKRKGREGKERGKVRSVTQ